MDKIGQQWQRFEAEILPGPEFPEIQKQEMRRAFYCGVECMFSIMMNAPNNTDEENAEIFKTIEAELGQFGQDLENGIA